VVCIAYRPAFDNTSLYHTAYVIDLVKNNPNSMAFKIGENVGREKLRLVLRQGVLAD
jgi:hypothetical protein